MMMLSLTQGKKNVFLRFSKVAGKRVYTGKNFV